jgi:hypothetical protein
MRVDMRWMAKWLGTVLAAVALGGIYVVIYVGFIQSAVTEGAGGWKVTLVTMPTMELGIMLVAFGILSFRGHRARAVPRPIVLLACFDLVDLAVRLGYGLVRAVI